MCELLPLQQVQMVYLVHFVHNNICHINQIFITALGLHNASFRYIDIDICNFDMTGISNSSDKKWRILDAEEDRRFIKENIPDRIYKYYRDADKKIKLYDNLHRTKFLWKIVMFLSVIAKKLYGPLTKIKIERID